MWNKIIITIGILLLAGCSTLDVEQNVKDYCSLPPSVKQLVLQKVRQYDPQWIPVCPIDETINYNDQPMNYTTPPSNYSAH